MSYRKREFDFVTVHTAQKHGGEVNGFPDYLIKWIGLPYSECTWEDGALVATRFREAIEQYNMRNKSTHIPNKNCRVCTCYEVAGEN